MAYAKSEEHIQTADAYRQVLRLWVHRNSTSVDFWKLEFSDEDSPNFVLSGEDQFLIPERKVDPGLKPASAQVSDCHELTALWIASHNRSRRVIVYYQIGLSEIARGYYANAVEAFEQIVPEPVG